MIDAKKALSEMLQMENVFPSPMVMKIFLANVMKLVVFLRVSFSRIYFTVLPFRIMNVVIYTHSIK